ncbi:hypothetical protein NE237_014702 [Protea cynaroides]|uniref:Uncharacterized protein n=1 Tax=Protea cynaroides TaxID=273540 RepID=A0A9Q0KCT4_9MAGN|nr:hypothetical protein NE237_014702 [Protea cynaroides]
MKAACVERWGSGTLIQNQLATDLRSQMEFLSGRGKDLFPVGVAVFGGQNGYRVWHDGEWNNGASLLHAWAPRLSHVINAMVSLKVSRSVVADLRPGFVVDRRLQREGNQGDRLYRESVAAVCKSGAMAKSVKIGPNKEGFTDMGRSLGFPFADPMNLVKQLAPHADSIHGVMLLDHNLSAEARILLDVSSSGFISQRQHGANQRMISHVQGSGPRVIGEQM